MILSTILSWIASTGVKVLIALIILVIGFNVVNAVASKLEPKLVAKLDETLTRTLVYAGKILAKIIIVVALVGYLGIDTTGISALIASMGVCVGLAVNGTLSNLAGGVMIILTRPFKLGDYISAQGFEGTVEEIRIVNTKIITVDNKVVYIPNGALSSGSIMNYSDKPMRRVDLEFSVAGNDPSEVRRILLDVCDAEAKVSKEMPPFARITDFGAGNGTKVTLRAWTETGSYWDTYFDLLDNIRKAFEANHIVIPFNQLDVHMKEDK